jgi:lysozyme family protein
MKRVHPRVDAIVKDTIRKEGKFSDDPFDKGGPTNYGVSLRYARGKGLVLDLDKDGDVDRDDILLVTPQIAYDLFLEDFYYDPRIDQLPDAIEPLLFDWAVNGGPDAPIRSLQRVIGDLSTERIAVDGRIGPITRAAAERCWASYGNFFLNRLVNERLQFHSRIAKTDPTQRRFLNGWLARTETFRPKSG